MLDNSLSSLTQYRLVSGVEDFDHQSPLFGRRSACRATLELTDVCLPFSLARQTCQPLHIAFKVEIIDGIHDHEQVTATPIDLHLDDAHFSLPMNNLRPDMGMGLYISLNQRLVIYERQGLAVAFHIFWSLIVSVRWRCPENWDTSSIFSHFCCYCPCYWDIDST